MYIDTTNDSSGRICLNAAVADSAYKLISSSTNNALGVGSATVPTYFAGGIPTACSSLSLNTSGNAATATKLAKAVNIKLTGSVTGSTSFDGSGDVSISTTTNHNHDDRYLKLTGGNLTGTVNSTGNINLNGSNAYFSLGITPSGSRCYFQTYNAVTNGTDDSNLQAGFGFGWAKSLTVDKSGNVNIAGDLVVSGGDITGNASSATKATKDGDNNVITTTYVKKSGDTMSGALNFANGTWNNVGDDCALGDYDQAGVIGIKGLNGATGIYFVPYSGSVAQKIFIDGAGTMSITGKVSTETLQTVSNGVISTIGSQNNVWLHYRTNSSGGHWFNKSVAVQGNIYAGTNYSDLVLTSANFSNYALPLTGGTLTGGLTISNGGLSVSGRVANSGDDEGIVIRKADNGYAGLCLGDPAGVRSVFYLLPDNGAEWRYYNTSGPHKITHPAKSGVIALTTDLDLLAKKDGTNATGTWPISISGNAATASLAAKLNANNAKSNKATRFSSGLPIECDYLLDHSVSGNAGTATLLQLHNTVTNTSTRSIAASSWNGAVSGVKYMWGQSFKDTSIGNDTGDLVLALRAGQYSGGTELCMMIDGDYYSMGNKVLHAGNYSSYASPASYWSWSGQSGQPTWVWGGNDFGQYKVWNPSNFNVNSAKSSTSSSYLSINNSANLSNCLQYIQVSAQNSGNDLPTNAWWHVIKMNHGQGDTYYKRLLAFDFWNDNIMTSGAAGDGVTRSWKQVWVQGNAVTGAVWNDYAECRESDCSEAGYVLAENGNDSLSKTTERLSSFAGVSSDTWGFSQGETEKAKTHIAVAGRVLVYPYQNRNNYKPGDCVCAAPGGTVDIMTREEVINWPDRIVGTVSCVPEYEEWGGGEIADRDPVKVNGRIWIKVV